MEIKTKEPLKNYSWWKVGGLADYFCQPQNLDQLKQALKWAKDHHQAFRVLGSGTNVLISDKGVRGLVISSTQLNFCTFKKTNSHLFINCGAGTLKSQLMKIFKNHQLAPALFLSGLPGDVGGGIVMNAGVSRLFKPSCFSQIIESFKVLTPKGELKTFLNQEISWFYRKSSGWGQGVIYEACIKWPLQKTTDLNQKIKTEIKKRRATQPLDKASCGSVFKNPYPKFAGQLIEQAGLKGLKIGQAQVSHKHANFIINLGGAKAQDIASLIQQIRQKVYQRFGLNLETEVHYMGEWESVKTT